MENIRRAGEVAKLMTECGLLVICSVISPSRAEREMVRGLFATEEFIEIFVDAPLEVCEARDPKQLYKKARAGEIREFTGIDAPYEKPEDPEITVRTADLTIDESVAAILERLLTRLRAED